MKRKTLVEYEDTSSDVRSIYDEIMATMGLEVNKALLNYLADGNHKIERKGSTFWEGVQLSMNRPRPPRCQAIRQRASADSGAVPKSRYSPNQISPARSWG